MAGRRQIPLEDIRPAVTPQHAHGGSVRLLKPGPLAPPCKPASSGGRQSMIKSRSTAALIGGMDASVPTRQSYPQPVCDRCCCHLPAPTRSCRRRRRAIHGRRRALRSGLPGGHGLTGWANAERSPGHRGGDTALPGPAQTRLAACPGGILRPGSPTACPGRSGLKGNSNVLNRKHHVAGGAAMDAVLGICREGPPGWPLGPARWASSPKA